jgi:hypothetical protein
MKPRMIWSTPRHGLRRALELALALAVSSCCHNPAEQQQQQQVQKFVPEPTAAAKEAFEKIRAGLGGEEMKGSEGTIGPLMAKAISESAPHPFADLQGEFVRNLRCRKLGCYAELVADKPERAARINEFVTDARSPLAHWHSWRFVSGLYLADGNQAGGTDQLRRVAVVVLDQKHQVMK